MTTAGLHLNSNRLGVNYVSNRLRMVKDKDAHGSGEKTEKIKRTKREFAL